MSQFENFAKPLNSTKSFKNSGSIIPPSEKYEFLGHTVGLSPLDHLCWVECGRALQDLNLSAIAHITFSHMLPWKWHHVPGSDQELTYILRNNGSLKRQDNFPILSRDEVALPVVLVMYCSLPQLLSGIHLTCQKLDQSNLNSHFKNQTIEFIDSFPLQLGFYQLNS